MTASRPRPALLAPLLTAAAVLILVLLAGELLVAHPDWSLTEQSWIRTVQSAGNPVLDVAAYAIGLMFGPAGAIFVVLIVAATAILVGRGWTGTVHTLLVIVVPWTIAEVLKEVVRRPRPGSDLASAGVHPLTFSFPSGHTAFAAAVCTAVVLTLVARRARAVTIVIAVVIVVATAWSRVYLGVHYPTDVVASLVLVPTLSIAVDRAVTRMPIFARASVETTRQ